jgi:hypothetical protein
MIRNSKRFGAILMGVFALAAFGAQAASAVPLTVNEGAIGTTFYTGDQDGGSLEFRTPSGTVKCTTVVFTATSTGATVDELTVSSTISGCVAFGFSTAHVKTNGCAYTFTTPTTLSSSEVTWGNEQLHFVCPVGKSMEITPTAFGVSGCTQFMGAQTPTGGHVLCTNKGGIGANEMDLTLETTLSGLHYIWHRRRLRQRRNTLRRRNSRQQHSPRLLKRSSPSSAASLFAVGDHKAVRAGIMPAPPATLKAQDMDSHSLRRSSASTHPRFIGTGSERLICVPDGKLIAALSAILT